MEQVLEGIFYVLRTGCQWKAVPRKFGCGSGIHRYFQEWQAAGFFEKKWVLGLEKYDELEGIGWEWQSVDGCMIKAPLARESMGHNPTDRGKNENKTQRLNGWKEDFRCLLFFREQTRMTLSFLKQRRIKLLFLVRQSVTSIHKISVWMPAIQGVPNQLRHVNILPISAPEVTSAKR